MTIVITTNLILNKINSSNFKRVDHPLYFTWNDRKNKNLLCDDWLDFNNFINAVGVRPSDDHKLWRRDKTKVFSPDNFIWLKAFKRKENESRNEYDLRLRRDKADSFKNTELKKNFGITLEKYNEILKTQNYVCAICNEPEKVIHHKNKLVKALAVDHCHKSGKIRGLLCQRCNRTLGKLKDSVELLDKMKVYLNDNG